MSKISIFLTLKVKGTGKNGQNSNTVQASKTTISSKLLIRQRFKEYRCACESGKPLFKLRVNTIYYDKHLKFLNFEKYIIINKSFLSKTIFLCSKLRILLRKTVIFSHQQFLFLFMHDKNLTSNMPLFM